MPSLRKTSVGTRAIGPALVRASRRGGYLRIASAFAAAGVTCVVAAPQGRWAREAVLVSFVGRPKNADAARVGLTEGSFLNLNKPVGEWQGDFHRRALTLDTAASCEI